MRNEGPFTDERGSQALEFVALFPLMLITILVMWQFALAAYTLVVAEAAVRDGARAAAVGAGWQEAAERAAAGLLVEVEAPEYSATTYGEAVTLRLRVRLPMVPLPVLRDREVWARASATMPAR